MSLRAMGPFFSRKREKTLYSEQSSPGRHQQCRIDDADARRFGLDAEARAIGTAGKPEERALLADAETDLAIVIGLALRATGIGIAHGDKRAEIAALRLVAPDKKYQGDGRRKSV